MTNSDTGHGGHEEQLRVELETARTERDQALTELAELKARLTAQDIVVGTTATQPLPPPPKERHLRLIKGGALGAALLAGVE